MKCGRRAVLVAFALTGCSLDPTVAAPSATDPEPAPSPTQGPGVSAAAEAVSALAGAIESGRAAAGAPDGYPAWADGAGIALGEVLGRLAAIDPVSGGEAYFAIPAPTPPAAGTYADVGAAIAASSAAAETALRTAALEAGSQPMRLLLASAACTARSLAGLGPAPVEGTATPRHFQGTTIAASMPIALSHAWALVYGLGVGLGRLDDDDPLSALGAARLAAAKGLRNELRDALPGQPPVQPASFELPTPMTTGDEIRQGWGELELALVEGLGRVVAAGGPDVERWLELMVAQSDDVLAWGRGLPPWPGWA